MFETHPMLFAVAPDRELEPFGQGIDDRNADAVQAARHFIGIVVARILELTAGVQLGHNDLGRRNAFLGVDASRAAAAIILDADRPTYETRRVGKDCVIKCRTRRSPYS